MTGSSSVVVTVTNPFVGPRFIETGQKIFGRDREIEQLYYLLSAERVVLLHSPSGAGKSSLIRAGLIPRLKEPFDVWGPTRVSLEPPEGCPIAANRFVQSVNLGFEAGLPEERQRPAKISAMGLSEYVAGRPRRRSASPNIVLIFDQFEEILTIDPLALEAKHEFFDQVGKLLQDHPHVWALFALREDYLAPLDPYAEQVPTHLKNRFRLDLLGREAAREVIARSVEEGGRRSRLRQWESWSTTWRRCRCNVRTERLRAKPAHTSSRCICRWPAGSCGTVCRRTGGPSTWMTSSRSAMSQRPLPTITRKRSPKSQAATRGWRELSASG